MKITPKPFVESALVFANVTQHKTKVHERLCYFVFLMFRFNFAEIILDLLNRTRNEHIYDASQNVLRLPTFTTVFSTA